MKPLHFRNCFSSQRQWGFDGPGRLNSQSKFLLQTKPCWLSHSFIFNELQHSLWSKAGSLTQEEKWFLRWIYCKPCLISKHLVFFFTYWTRGVTWVPVVSSLFEGAMTHHYLVSFQRKGMEPLKKYSLLLVTTNISTKYQIRMSQRIMVDKKKKKNLHSNFLSIHSWVAAYPGW